MFKITKREDVLPTGTSLSLSQYYNTPLLSIIAPAVLELVRGCGLSESDNTLLRKLHIKLIQVK